MKIIEIQLHLDKADQLIVHTENQSARIFGAYDGSLQIDRMDEAEKRIGKRPNETGT